MLNILVMGSCKFELTVYIIHYDYDTVIGYTQHDVYLIKNHIT